MITITMRSVEVAKDNEYLSLQRHTHTSMRINVYFSLSLSLSSRFSIDNRIDFKRVEKSYDPFKKYCRKIISMNSLIIVIIMHLCLRTVNVYDIIHLLLFVFFLFHFDLIGFPQSQQTSFFFFLWYEHCAVFCDYCHFIVLCYQIVAFKLRAHTVIRRALT